MHHIACGLIFLAALFSSVGAVFGEDDRDARPVIEEFAFPEGISSAQSIEIDATGRVWFIESVGKHLLVFDPTTKKFNSFTLPGTWGDVGFSKFAISPKGEIWFSVSRWVKGGKEPNMLGLFTPSDGYFTRFVLSTETYPEEIMVDARGVVWFTATNKNSLFRIDPVKSSIKGYALPAVDSYPGSLKSDKNGHIWFVEGGANKIGEFDPDKELFYEHAIPTKFSNPAKISIDKSGKVWFVEMAANRIGVYYPDLKRFDEAIIPTSNSSPNALVHDSEDNIWFLEYRGNKVGFFNPKQAAFHEFDIPNFNSQPGGMAIDLERSVIWFTQSSTEAKRFGRLSISEAMAEIAK
jgi:streptogramin lyase